MSSDPHSRLISLENAGGCRFLSRPPPFFLKSFTFFESQLRSFTHRFSCVLKAPKKRPGKEQRWVLSISSGIWNGSESKKPLGVLRPIRRSSGHGCFLAKAEQISWDKGGSGLMTRDPVPSGLERGEERRGRVQVLRGSTFGVCLAYTEA